jgi:hypothetical protein
VGDVTIVVNNATITPIGSAPNVPIEQWDESYRVNLRGPALMAIEFLPEMIAQNCGVFLCVASLGEAFLAAYETLKTAQVRMATTLDVELKDKEVFCLTVNPGLVRTPRAMHCIKSLASIYGITEDEFIRNTGEGIISAEAAGAGFAAAVVLAEQFRGQEITSRQALLAVGIKVANQPLYNPGKRLPEQTRKEAEEICESIIVRLTEQAGKWDDKSKLERQWFSQDFKTVAGMPVETWIQSLQRLEGTLQNNAPLKGEIPLEKLAGYYDHLQKFASTHETDARKMEEQVLAYQYWQKEVEELKDLIQQKG